MIKLTTNEYGEVIINIAQIKYIYPYNNGAQVILDKDIFFNVFETPDEVLTKIGKYKVDEFTTLALCLGKAISF